MSNAIATETTPPVGEEPTADDLEQVQWAQDSIRNAAVTLIDSLKQLVTLNSVLLAGSAAFLSNSTMPRWIKGAAAVCFLFSLGCSLWGSLPREVQICPNLPDQIRLSRERGAADRLRWLKVSAGAFFGGLLALAIGFTL